MPFKVNKRFLSLFLAILMSLSLLSGCKDKENKADGNDKNPSKVSSQESTTLSSKKKEAASEKATKGSSKGSNDKTQNNKAPINKKPNSVATTKSNEAVSNGISNIADSSYDKEIEVSKGNINSVETEEYKYLPRSEYINHLTQKWNSFEVKDKVKVEAQYMDEYLTMPCTPLKNTFGEINCNGYSVTYAYDRTNTYAYLDIDWSYYVNKSQYDASRAVANSICNSVEKIRAVHNKIGIDTTYKAGVDGIYNCLVNKCCDCDGYTAAFKVCMDLLGVPCKAYATSNHIFNLVQLGGQWYIVDATFDDQTPNGYVFAKYFLVGKNTAPTYQKDCSSYNELYNLLSASDYACDRPIIITDEDKFKSHAGVNPKYTCKPDSNGKVLVYNGESHVGTVTFS